MRWEDCRSTKVESFARARKQRCGQRLCGTGLGQRHERQLDAARVITSGLPTNGTELLHILCNPCTGYNYAHQ